MRLNYEFLYLYFILILYYFILTSTYTNSTMKNMVNNTTSYKYNERKCAIKR
jgi:hypothetical protein